MKLRVGLFSTCLRTRWQKSAIFTPKIIRTSVGQARASEFLYVGYTDYDNIFATECEYMLLNN